MIAFKVDAKKLEQALRTTPDGHLCLGPTGVSVERAVCLPLGSEVRFRDYLMEGFVTYGITRVERDGGVWLEVVPHGTSRDPFLRSHLRWLLGAAGVEPLAELQDDGSVDGAAT